MRPGEAWTQEQKTLAVGWTQEAEPKLEAVVRPGEAGTRMTKELAALVVLKEG